MVSQIIFWLEDITPHILTGSQYLVCDRIICNTTPPSPFSSQSMSRNMPHDLFDSIRTRAYRLGILRVNPRRRVLRRPHVNGQSRQHMS